MTTAKVVEEFVKFYSENIEEATVSEMKKKLSEIFKTVSTNTEIVEEDKKEKKGKKEKKEKEVKEVKEEKEVKEKKKREPTAYNLFLKEKMAELKGNEMNVREKMNECARLWKIEKESKE